MFNEFGRTQRLEKIVVREIRETRKETNERIHKNHENEKVVQPDMRLIERMSRNALMAR